MIIDGVLIAIVGACTWGVLDKRLKTRTMGTMALSLIAILAAVSLCRP